MCDLDGDGAIDYQEFIAAAIDHKKYLTEANIKRVFDLFDRNGSGKIDTSEFSITLPKNYEIDQTELFKTNNSNPNIQPINSMGLG